MGTGGATPAGSSCALRLDPLALPVRYRAADPAADERVRLVELDRERVTLRRSVRGVRMKVSVPVSAFLGVAMRLASPEALDAGTVAVMLEHRDPAEWVRLLRLVTAAPNQLDQRKEPASQVRALTAWADQRDVPLALVGRLVTASWLYADPLSASHRRGLLREMAADLHQIAPYSTDGLTLLRDEADRYRDAAAGDGSYG